MCQVVARYGTLDVLKYVRKEGIFPWDERGGVRAIRDAASMGNLEMVKWMRENGCEWDCWTTGYAAGGGHIELLEWLREQNCPWHPNTCAFAAEIYPQLETLKWLRAQNCPWGWRTCAWAAEYGNLVGQSDLILGIQVDTLPVTCHARKRARSFNEASQIESVLYES